MKAVDWTNESTFKEFTTSQYSVLVSVGGVLSLQISPAKDDDDDQ